jgi:glucosamine kinase
VAFFLGIDGGGTKTRCIVGDEESSLGAGTSSSSKVQRVGEACARDALSSAIHEACVQAGISPRKITRTCAGITGSARAEIAGIMRHLLMSLVGGEIEIVGDVETAFYDAFGSAPGVIVIAGTGSVVFGRNESGETARVGGWGYPVADEGSGYWIGVEAVRAALRQHDQGATPALLGKFAERIGAENFDQFIVRVNATPAPDFAALFPVVLSSAENGDTLAKAVLERAGQELARMAEILCLRLFAGSPAPVVTHGGVFSSSSIVMESFSRDLRQRCPTAALLDRHVDPARGALERARRAESGAPRDPTEARVSSPALPK